MKKHGIMGVVVFTAKKIPVPIKNITEMANQYSKARVLIL